MDRRALNSESGSVAFELLLLVPIPFVALVLMLGAFRIVEGAWATAVAARVAAWGQRLGPRAVAGERLLPTIQQITRDIDGLTVVASDGGAVQPSSIVDLVPLGVGVELLPRAQLASSARLAEARVTSRSGSIWKGVSRSATVLVGEFTAQESGLKDGEYRAVVQTVAASGLLGLGSFKVLP